ncbi:ADP-forming succinate--CoA ligase subunit beta [Actinobaculum sp. 352]|uniref:ADP-forming succinate--CoA ligase subunit beta n=1 Tax=Actinobaculum sp. 352 TaxID=2490946 RepID=UPI000F7F41DF|nr:ADP-forming succinate--CoA ligase subunit beta [Actinobaculum sp. 352]RTE50667.1 ADP-forming succinate--CoA ligase subunit beta [Actinobaculum sp. 352]
MDLYEYQARAIFEAHGIPVPPALLADTPEEAAEATQLLGTPVVIKAQVKTGGRGKAGGIRVVNGCQDAAAAANAMLGQSINDHPVSRLLVAKAERVATEYYVAIMLDRATRGYVALCSAAGGVDVERLASTQHGMIRQDIDLHIGITEAVARDITARAGLPGGVAKKVIPILVNLWRALLDEDATLVEVNPLAVLADGEIMALDAKMTLDDNARFRHPEWEALTDNAPRDPFEKHAAACGLHYVRLQGSVGVVGNGAGLVMATLDAVAHAGKHSGIAPANFLDIGGGASAAVMRDGLEIILADPSVQSVFVNVFGGITACDEVAAGIVSALDLLGDAANKPVVVRLAGNAVAAGRRILRESGQANITAADAMDDGAKQAVALAQRELEKNALTHRAEITGATRRPANVQATGGAGASGNAQAADE